MHLTTRNVNSAFRRLVNLFATPPVEGMVLRQPSRNGNVLVLGEPVTITYTHPRERVLFNPARDANPFMHLYEALWMLAGRNDVDSVAYYAKQMREYSDDGKTLNGAYGYRWRGQYLTIETEIPPSKKFPYGCRESEVKRIDQLDILVDHLKANPNSRRAVLQMWNVEDDLLKIGSDLDFMMGKESKDVCCNLSVMFTVRDTGKCGLCYNGKTETTDEGYCCGCLDRSPPRKDDGGSLKVLDMTVTNRSNDLIWGLLGANFVHFTILQEYMAARLGVEVGVYHHFTNNLHVYDWNWRPEEWLAADKGVEGSAVGGPVYPPTRNGQPTWYAVSLVQDCRDFDEDLGRFVEWYSRPRFDPKTWWEPFLDTVARPMFEAFAFHKRGKTDLALDLIETVAADDWRLSGKGWLERRNKG